MILPIPRRLPFQMLPIKLMFVMGMFVMGTVVMMMSVMMMSVTMIPKLVREAAAAETALLTSFPTSELTIETAKGPQHFAIELAQSEQQMMQGLMYRRALAPEAGMLFEYPKPQPVSFWMKNTLIPLDMLFIGADGRILEIHERAIPLSLEPITCDRQVLGVLEVNGGTAERLGLKPGDRIRHALFGTAP
jgi:uncharacterized protein